MRRFALVLVTAMAWGIACAAPYIPEDGGKVLEVLPGRNDPLQQAFARMRARLKQDPQNVDLAGRLAQMYESASRTDGDPRYLGYAQAALKPWWDAPQPPGAVLLQKAIILQSTHRFDESLAALESVLAADPRNGQAWLTRGTVLAVVGRHAEARSACYSLRGLAYDIVLRACLGNVGALDSHAQASYADLSAALAQYPNASPDIRVWVTTLLAEMAARLGRPAEAEAHFRDAMAIDKPDGYLLGAYADFLLDHKRHAEAAALVKAHTRNDALLLRYALALKMQQAPETHANIEALRQRFAAAAMRGDSVHQREQARYELHLLGQPRQALRTALSNWKVQKEPADLRILLETATAAGDSQAMALAIDWIDRTQFEDQTLAAMVSAARGKA
jgi:tetratricopeptide (TPR) repeat protein